jgi:hypothetical protein
VVWFGNQFLTLASSGVRMFVCADEWMEWEVHCTRLLYPSRPAVKVGPGKAVSIPEVRGVSLRQLIERDEPDVKPFVAAARELRRVHHLECESFKGPWSHGDLHLDNVIYDPAADRAVLIDFDTRHEFGIDQLRRHGDDLKVFLLELIAMPNESWLPLATAFVEEYGEPSVLDEVSRQLVVPRGFARILWFTRTNCASIRRIEPRMARLREELRRVTAVSSH